MKKTFQKLVVCMALVLTLTFSVFADGAVPIMGVQGCAPGTLWMPDNICCQPNTECPYGGGGDLTAISPEKPGDSIFDFLLSFEIFTF